MPNLQSQIPGQQGSEKGESRSCLEVKRKPPVAKHTEIKWETQRRAIPALPDGEYLWMPVKIILDNQEKAKGDNPPMASCLLQNKICMFPQTQELTPAGTLTSVSSTSCYSLVSIFPCTCQVLPAFGFASEVPSTCLNLLPPPQTSTRLVPLLFTSEHDFYHSRQTHNPLKVGIAMSCSKRFILLLS